MKKLMTFLNAAFGLGLAVGASAAILHVPSQYPTIQAGIGGAVHGDTVLVANGIYTGPGNRDIDFVGKAILVTSRDGPDVTIIDCQGDSLDPHRGFYFHHGEDCMQQDRSRRTVVGRSFA